MRDIDWTYTLETAVYHRLSPLLCRWLGRYGSAGTPPAVHARLHHDYWSNHFHNSELRRALEEVRGAAARRHIEIMPMKGAWLVWEDGSDAALRPMGDIDLSVRDGDLEAFGSVLAEIGYTRHQGLASYVTEGRLRSASREHQWRRQDASSAVAIEYRAQPLEVTFWRLSDLDRGLAAELDDQTRLMWARAGRCPERPGLRRMSREDALLVMAAHLTKHADFRLIWLHDIGAVLARAAGIDVAYVCEQAARARMAGPMLAVLHGATGLTGAAWPAGLEAGLQDAAGRRRSLLSRAEVGAIQRRFLRLDAVDLRVQTSPFWLLISALARVDGWRARGAAIRWTVFPSRAVVRRWEPAQWHGPGAYLIAVARRYTRALARLWSTLARP